MVAKPFGAITIEGANHDAIMLNGKKADFFVGHGDEFNDGLKPSGNCPPLFSPTTGAWI
jgi:hypothetical protein